MGAQAKAKQSILGERASALEVQQIFRQICEDSVVNYDTSTWIHSMNRSIQSTNVVLNLAISPSLWLLPSNFVILEKPIDGYNNKLRAADDSMKFGLNKTVNYFGSTHNQPKKVHQETPSHHLETLEKHVEPKIHREVSSQLETVHNNKLVEPKRNQKISMQPINNSNNNDLRSQAVLSKKLSESLTGIEPITF